MVIVLIAAVQQIYFQHNKQTKEGLRWAASLAVYAVCWCYSAGVAFMSVPTILFSALRANL